MGMHLLTLVEETITQKRQYFITTRGVYNIRPKAVAFWVTNPCRNTRKVKQTKMYVCTLEEFILVDLDTLLCKLELNSIGNAVVYIQWQQ